MVSIEKNSIKRVVGKSCDIECNTGSIWITYKNSKDIILNTGESVTLDNKKNIIIQGLTDSKYAVVSR